MTFRLLLFVLALACLPCAALAADNVAFKHEGRTLRISGRIVREAGGGVLLLAPDGQLWNIAPDDLIERQTDDKPFKPLSNAEFASQLLKEMPPKSKIHETAHYLICYNTSLAYAQWCGALYERLHKAYRNYWKKLGWDLADPEFPLVALVFDDQDSYAEYARKEGVDGKSVVAYYNFGNNRVVMYDLTGADALGAPRGKRAKVNEILSAPEAQLLVATIIHEATHQLSFNCGLHQRYADVPLWVSEGTAIYFETPDLKSTGDGWKTIGAFSQSRHQTFLSSLKDRPANGLELLLTDDKLFKDPKTARERYAEAWALNFYLFQNQKRKADYAAYLKTLSKKEPGIVDDPAARLAAFQAIFGNDLAKLDADFIKFMRSQRK